MKVLQFLGKSINFRRTTVSYVREDRQHLSLRLYNFRCMNASQILKFYIQPFGLACFGCDGQTVSVSPAEQKLRL
jgi:hypothetical protein